MPDTQTLDTASQAPDIKSALAGFTEDFKGFRTDLEARMTRQSQRLDALDRKAVAATRLRRADCVYRALVEWGDAA